MSKSVFVKEEKSEKDLLLTRDFRVYLSEEQKEEIVSSFEKSFGEIKENEKFEIECRIVIKTYKDDSKNT